MLKTIETLASITFRIRATQADVSMLVGKNGRMARALRTPLTGMRRPETRPYLLDIVQQRKNESSAFGAFSEMLDDQM